MCLSETTGANTQHYIHSPRGIHAMNDGSNWSYMLQDGLGSVRAEIGASVAINGSQSYAPYGEVFGASGSMSSPFAFTGEPLDANGLQYHRARYMNPMMGGFLSLDPWEGNQNRPMSLNGYNWVSGNPISRIDPTGLQDITTIGINWDAILDDVIRGMEQQRDWDKVLQEVLEQATGEASEELMEEGARRLLSSGAIVRVGAAGVFVNSLMTYEYRGRYGTAWQHQLGLTTIYDNVSLYSNLTPQTALEKLGIYYTSTDDGTMCQVGSFTSTNTQTQTQLLLSPEQVGLATSTVTTTRNNTTCDPEAFGEWWNGLPDAQPAGGAGRKYEAYAARGIGTMGSTKRVSTGAIITQTNIPSLRGLNLINADGASKENCRLIEAKDGSGGQYRTGSPPPWLRPTQGDFDVDSVFGELLRYRMAVYSNPLVHGLEIRTNTSESLTYFSGLLPSFGFMLGVDAWVNLYL